MIRGTNVEFRFNLPYNFSDLDVVKITFWQDGYNGPARYRPLPITKFLAQCRQGENERQLSVVLNQEETLRFTDKRRAKVQLRATTLTGVPIATKEHLVTVYPVGDDSILDVTPTPMPDEWVYLDGEAIV